MSRYCYAQRNSLPWPSLPVANSDMLNASVVIIGGGISGKFRSFTFETCVCSKYTAESAK